MPPLKGTESRLKILPLDGLLLCVELWLNEEVDECWLMGEAESQVCFSAGKYVCGPLVRACSLASQTETGRKERVVPIHGCIHRGFLVDLSTSRSSSSERTDTSKDGSASSAWSCNSDRGSRSYRGRKQINSGD